MSKEINIQENKKQTLFLLKKERMKNRFMKKINPKECLKRNAVKVLKTQIRSIIINGVKEQ